MFDRHRNPAEPPVQQRSTRQKFHPAAAVWRTILLALLPLVSCSDVTPPAEINADIAAYVDRLRDWAPVEGEAGRSVDRLIATHFVDESAVLHELQDALPRSEEQIERALSYSPRTRDVQAIHAEYTAAWTALHDGLEQIRHGITTADGHALSAGREAILTWRNSLQRIARQIRALRTKTSQTTAAPYAPKTKMA